MHARPEMKESPIGHIAYAFQFDATLYARYLRSLAEQHAVRRTEGKIVDVTLHDSGDIASVTLEDGQILDADFFIDCSGFRGLLIEQALKTGYDDWSNWLPCDRAMAVPCSRVAPLTPYTRATARDAGWQWRIPLQHRTGNGFVYSSKYIDDDSAEKLLLANLDGEQLANPNKLRFTTGKRRKMWNRNCVAIGLSAGFLEPIESTSIHLVQSSAIRLVRLFPDGATDQATIDEFNRQTDFEWERVRDFLILHYWANQRDGDLWKYCRTMEIPATLRRKVDVWCSNGRIFREDDELFSEESWIQVFLGQGLVPRSHDPLVAIKSDPQIEQFLGNIAATIGRCLDVMPSHTDYVAKYCPADPIA
jgi:tryptophan halogenase